MQVQKDDAASCGRCYLYASRRVADVTASHRPCERGACRRSCVDSASMCRCCSAFALAAELAEVAVARGPFSGPSTRTPPRSSIDGRCPGPLICNLFRTIDLEMVLYKCPLCVRLFILSSETLIVISFRQTKTKFGPS